MAATEPRQEVNPVDMAERIVLGSMMSDATVVDAVARRITADSFGSARHALIFCAILAAHAAGEPTEPYAMTARMSGDGSIVKAGGAPYLLDLVQVVAVPAQASHYADTVAAAAVARGLDRVGVRAQQLASELAMASPDQAVARVRDELDSLTTTAAADDPIKWRDLADPGLEAIEKAGQPDADTAALSTGLPDLDKILNGGIRASQLVVIGARPGHGKSSLSRVFAAAAAFRQNAATLVVTLEMNRFEVYNAILSAEMAIDLGRVNSGQMTDVEWSRAARFVAQTIDAPLWIDDTAGTTLADIRAKAHRLKRTANLRLLVVDYLQLVEVSGRSENRQVAVSALSRGLKSLAQELGITVVLCAQLNRGPEQRTDKRPQSSDFRESGSIENDANVILLVHREEAYVKNSPRTGEADIIVAKNRSGRLADVVVAAQLHFARFVSMAVDP